MIDEMMANIDEIWPGNGSRGPDLLCLETGFHRAPFIFASAMIEVVRRAPELPTNEAILYKEQTFIDMQRRLFDRLFEQYVKDTSKEVGKLRDFVSSLALT